MKHILLLLTLFVVPSFASEQEFQEELDKLCEKTMVCAKAQLPPSMQGMAESMMGGMCQAYDKAFEGAWTSQFKEVYSAAQRCVRSMAALSCAALMDDPETPACQDYQEVAAEYQNQ